MGGAVLVGGAWEVRSCHDGGGASETSSGDDDEVTASILQGDFLRPCRRSAPVASARWAEPLLLRALHQERARGTR